MAPPACVEELRALAQQVLAMAGDGAALLAEQRLLVAAAVVGLIIVYVIVDYLRASAVPTLNVELTEGDWRALALACAGRPAALRLVSKPSLRALCATATARPKQTPRCPAAETCDQISGDKYVVPKALPKDRVPCYDPGNMQYLGDMPAMMPEQVRMYLASVPHCWRTRHVRRR